MSTYTFLPWLRRGIISMANAPAEKERLLAPLQLQVTGEGETPVPIQRNAQLYGPGDVSGIDWRSIVRTVPRAGVRDFEANFLAAIEFYDEDFPWRYTPALPEPATGKLRPWIWLTVLEEQEYRRVTSIKGLLPAIEITPDALRNAFPDPDTTASWAHVHLNFAPGPAGAPVGELRKNVQQQLDADPNLGCSRLLCPRRLKPKSRYRAFLLPAFEKGRLAGLGRPEAEIMAIPNAQPSWPKAASIGPALTFPVYFEWEFVTDTAGDFEDLARKLVPLSLEEAGLLADAAQLLDVRDPGWGLKGAAGALRMESALKLPSPPTVPPAEIADKKVLRSKMAPLLNLGVEPIADDKAKNTQHPYFSDETKPGQPASLADDPIVVPPLYGSFYRLGVALPAQPDEPKDWYPQLNLHPVYRVAAAQGTAIVQQNQEEFMDRAWDQWSVYAEIQQTSRRWAFSAQVSQSMYTKRLEPMLQPNPREDREYRAIGFFAPMHRSLTMQAGGKSMISTLRTTRWPSTHSRAFTKLTRPGGPLMRRFQGKTTGSSFFLVKPVPASVLFIAPIKYATDAAVTYLFEKKELNDYLLNQGLGTWEACKGALAAWQPYLMPRDTSPPAPPGAETNKQVFGALAGQVKPTVTINQRFQKMVADTYPAVTNPTALPPEAPSFPEPMYKALAERSSDFILPGLDRIPPNRATILDPNQAFIESFLTGLNHEMAREFLWREFPAPLNATYFRQFWDTRNSASPLADIIPVKTWGPDTALGTHRPPPSGKPLVVAIRGDLLRKYPNTEIFMVKADWDKQALGSHKPVLDPKNPELWKNPPATSLLRPIFSAHIEPDYMFLGFPLPSETARGDNNQPGWFFVLKERAGEVHFGLDIKADPPGDASWEALEEVAENQCINIDSAKFLGLPRAGKRADQTASALYQKPFMLFVHASRLLPKK